ncbi:MAG: acyl-CoA thioesterase [Muribaculaceae bacterium]|jgi:acyl-CoA thioester hydrolase|nr:acyl-CoA thioesterase [Muribaculaceae bacterium]
MGNYCAPHIKSFRHRMPLQMRFNDIDMLGHLNNSIYLTFMDLAKTRYFEAVLGENLKWDRIGVVIVNINCNFCAPTFFNEEIEVETAVVAIGEKSLTIEQRVFSPSTGQVKCDCRTIMSGFDMETNTSAPILPEWVKAFETYENRTLRKNQ